MLFVRLQMSWHLGTHSGLEISEHVQHALHGLISRLLGGAYYKHVCALFRKLTSTATLEQCGVLTSIQALCVQALYVLPICVVRYSLTTELPMIRFVDEL